MTTSATESQLRSYVDRMENLAGEAKAVSDDKKELSAEIKGQGYCPKTIATLVKRRLADKDKLEESDAMLSLYQETLGD